MPRPLWTDPYASDAVSLLREPAQARAAAVRQVAEAQARAEEQRSNALARAADQRGNANANALMQSGNANANAQLQSGNAWAGAAQQIGQTVAAIPNQIAVAQESSRRDAMQKLAMAQAQRQNTAEERIEETRRNIGALMSDPEVLNEDGTFNAKGILSRLSAPRGDMVGPVQAPDASVVFGIIDPINESLTKSRQLEQQFQEHKTNTLARMAESILKLGAPSEANPRGSYLEHTQLGLAAAIKSGVISQEQANSFLAQMAEQPESVPMILRDLASRSTLKRETPTEASLAFDAAGGNQQAAGAMKILKPAQQRVPTEASLALEAAGGDPSGALALLKPPKETKETRSLDVQAAEALASGDIDTYNRLLKVKKEMGQADDRPRITVNTTGPNVNIPGDWEKTGSDFLPTIPAQWRKTVEKIANYDEDPAKVASMRGGMREMLMQWVNQVNPSYDASQFSNRAPTRKAFTTGTQGQQINAINTALGHIDQLDTLVKQLGNGSFTPGNKAWNSVRTIFGSDKVTNFDTLKDALAGEVSSVLAKSGATVAGIKDAQEKINSANSPTQLMGYVKTQIPIMGSKLASLDYQFHQAMGENDKFSALSPDSKAILSRMGFDPAHPAIGGSAPTGGVTILSITPKK